jgi:hypothetical protein|tara:strand:- start:684 stop:911 length:228 start_codon:yes stop_codon:yes gene_type:complete
MQSNKLLKIAREIVKKDKALFDSLMEFEKTGKIRTKARLNFTVDKNVAANFQKFCREQGYNMSAKIEKAMKDIMG